jgi:hypothetical protein
MKMSKETVIILRRLQGLTSQKPSMNAHREHLPTLFFRGVTQ